MTTSLVLSCYNGEKYILEQLESLKDQTCSLDEVIIGDDCSTDHTAEIVEEYISSNKLINWRLVRGTENRGWKSNFAHLIQEASQDILFLCDQDDIWHSDKIAVMKAAMEQHPEDLLIVSGLDVVYMGDDIPVYNPVPIGSSPYQHLDPNPKWCRIMRPGCVFALNRQFAQTCFAKYWHEGLAHDLFIWQCAFLADAIGYVNEALITYRRFPSSATAGKFASKKDFRIVENEIYLESLSAAMNTQAEPFYSPLAGKVAARSQTLEQKRQRFFETGSIIEWLSCAAQLDCYPFAKSWPADLYHIKMKKHQ